jgi:hypothetical protein
VLGSVFATRVHDLSIERITHLGIPGLTEASASASSAGSLDLSKLPEPIAEAIRSSYGDSIGRLFMIAAVISLLSLIAVVAMRSTRLREHFDDPATPQDETTAQLAS